MIYFLTRGNLNFSIVKQQHHGRFPPGGVGVPLVTRIPYPTLFHTILFPCAHQENSWREINHQRRKSTILFSSSYSSSRIRRKKQKSSRTSDTKKVSKNQIIIFTSNDVISAECEVDIGRRTPLKCKNYV